MKLLRTTLSLLSMTLVLGLTAQIAGPNGYMMGNYVEVGVAGDGGYEGADTVLGAVPGIHWRSDPGNPYHGFVADPQFTSWSAHDGDFFTPGTPENGWGLELGGSNGVRVSNNCVMHQSSSPMGIPGSVTNWQNDNGCIRVDWTGNFAGSGYDVTVDLVYEMRENDTYYTTEVFITNNDTASIDSLFYYRNVDPDNNETLSFDYTTQNTIVSQPDTSCLKALVSATQATPWNSYMGFGAMGENFRVAHGGFSNRDASDIWFGTGGLTGTVGATVFMDQAIAISYLVEDLDPGETENFKFLVILDGNQVEQAITSLYDFLITGGLLLGFDQCSQVDSVLTCWQPGSSFLINVQGPGVNDFDWTWSPPTGLNTTSGPNVICSASSPITYTLTGVPLTSCISDTIVKIMSIDITPAPILNLNINHPNCGMNDGSIEAIVTSGTPPITYDWLGGPSTPLWSGLGTGFYQLTISDTIGCTIDTLVELINPGAPTLSILNFQDTECGIPTGEITVGATGGTSPYTFDIGGGPQASGTFTGLNSGNYTITVEDAMGCQSNINFTISDTSTLAGVIINVVNEPCGSGQGELEVQATGGASPFTYDIGGGPQPTGLFTGLTTGWHTVTITDLGGCSYDVPVFVDEDPLDVDLGPDIITCDDDSLIVNAPGPYLWSTGATTQGIEVTVGGMYWVEVGSAPCTAYDTIVVTMLSGGTPPVLPNVFTPNGDGDNDLFNFVLPPFVENYRLRIYDIWGLLMFETTDKGNGWDGKDMGGTDVPDGTYFWTLEYVDPCVGPSIITHSGYVALFR